jgi:hypothetical protein
MVHMFLYYESTGKYVIDTVSKFYKGPIFLSLVENNCHNDVLVNYAKYNFPDIKLLYSDNYGTDQYGFYQTLKHDDSKTPWVFYCHDKHPSKEGWLKDCLEPFIGLNQDVFGKDVGIISSLKYKRSQLSFEQLLEDYAYVDYQYRKDIVESMHTLVWLHELERILLSKYKLGAKEFKHPVFSAGNILLIRRNILNKTHGCVYEQFFNKGIYRTDGEVEHGLERFYFYVSQCMGYNNLFI